MSADFELPREQIEEILDYNVAISTFENDAEQRRLIHKNPLIGFRIRTPNLTKAGLAEYRDFFVGKYGALESFTFLNPFDDETYTVRFEPNSFRTIYRAGYFQARFELRRVQ